MALRNDNSRSTASKCLAFCVGILKWIPVVFIVTVIAWSYYAYVIKLCLILYLIPFHLVFFIFVWAYWQTVFTPVGLVPSKFRLPLMEFEQFQSAESDQVQRTILESFALNLPVTTRTLTGAIRYCEKCQLVKPDRAHHCTVCGVCVLKMDHHCPWVNNCVSFTNYKYFILFLAYSLIYCLYITATTLKYFIRFWKNELGSNEGFHLLFLFFVAVMFATSLVSLFGYHCYLVSKNRSTLEAFRAPIFQTGPDKDGFSLGAYNNFQEIFGDNKKTWFLPIFTSLGDGTTYPVRTQHQAQYNSMGTTLATSLGDGVTYPIRSMDECTDHLLSNRENWTDDPEIDSPPVRESPTV